MQISIINVTTEKVKTYFVANVSYQDGRGETKTWKLMSFSNPATYAVLKDAKAGEQYEITTGKDNKDYTVWTSATKLAASPVTAAVANTKAAWVPDADRQRLIVKQSSLTAALKFIELTKGETNLEGIKTIADEFVAYVYDVEEPEVATAE